MPDRPGLELDRSPRPGADLRAAAAGPLAQRLSPRYWEEHALLPLSLTDSELVVAAGGAVDPTVVDELCWAYDRCVRLVAVSAAELQTAILSAQSSGGGEAGAVEAGGSDLELLQPEDVALVVARALAYQAPVF
jgi:hypothetical protein